MQDIFYELKYGARATIILLAANVFVFLLTYLFQEFFGVNRNQTLAFFGGMTPQSLFQYNWQHAITSNYLHQGIFHLGINMFGLYSIGKFLEDFYGTKRFFVTYFFAGVVGAVASVFFPLYVGSFVSSVGASGALYGLIGLIVGNKLRNNRYSPGLPLDSSGMSMIVLFLAIGFVVDGISGWAHLGGIVVGTICGLLMSTENSYDRTETGNKAIDILFWIALVLTLLAFPINFILNFS